MDNATKLTAFAGNRLLATGRRLDVALAVKAAMAADGSQTILIFDAGGRQVDFDLRGTDQDIATRLEAPEETAGDAKRAGRPKLGVIAREVTLLPRHWDWLAEQPGGASVTLRKLVDAARNSKAEQVRQAQAAADRFMGATLGDQPGYEEASRALYAGDRERFMALTEPWPADLRDHARCLAAAAFPDNG